MISNQNKTLTNPQTIQPPPLVIPRRRPFGRSTIIWLLVFLLSLGGLVGTALADLILNYGVSYGPNLDRVANVSPAQLGANPLGINVLFNDERDPNSPDIDRTFDLVKAGGFGFVRQLMPWGAVEPEQGQYDWTFYDTLIDKAQARGLQILLRLDRPPTWSRLKYLEGLSVEQKQQLTGPPDDPQTFFEFAGRVAERYKGKVRYYQIFNEPNLESEWNGRQVDARAYTALLKGAYERIKGVDPAALVLCAPLAPTDGPGLNRNDLLYLQEMYEAGAGQVFDIMSVQIYGLGYPPDFRYIQPDWRSKDLKKINFNRPSALREVMIRNGDGPKPVWAAEYGWISVPPAQLEHYKAPRPDGWDQSWGESVDAETQARYLRDGIERIRREWPWVGVINVWFLRPDPSLSANPANVTNYFSIVDQNFQPRPAYNLLKEYNQNRSSLAYTGWHPAAGLPALQTVGPGRLKLEFQGERAEMVLKGGQSLNKIGVRLDGQTERSLSVAALTRLTLTEGQDDKVHTLELSGLDAGAIEGFFISRDNHWAWLIVVSLLACSLLLLASGTRLTLLAANGLGRLAVWSLPRVRQGARVVRREFWPRRADWTPLAMAAALLLYYFAPPVPVAILGAVAFFPFCLIRPDWAVGLALLTAPLYLHPRNLRPGGTLEFTLTEVIIVELALAALVLGGVRVWSRRSAFSVPLLKDSARLLRPSSFLRSSAFIMVVLLVVATLSLLTPQADRLKEALREYRLVIVEPIALFGLALLFLRRRGSQGIAWLFDFLVVAGVAVAFGGLYQYLFHIKTATDLSPLGPNGAGQVVAAEGVTRVVSVYSHPDNLGLFLGRVIPVAVAFALFAPGGGGWQFWRWQSRRRQLYLLALVPLGATLVLSFSRGAWIGVGAALLAVIIAGRAWRWLAVYGVLGLGLLAALPFVKVERIASLFNFSGGSSGTRLYLWQSAIEMIRDHPLTGVGLDQFLYVYNPQYVNPLAWTERFTSHPHNLILDFWLRLGVLGLPVLAWLLWRFFSLVLARGVGQPAQASPAASLRQALGLGLFGSMIDFVVHGLVDNSFFVIDLAIIFCLSFAALEILRREAIEIERDKRAVVEIHKDKEKAV